MLKGLFRILPPFKGKYRLARLLLSEFIKNSRDVSVKGKHGIQYKLPNLKENIGFEIFIDGVYEPEYVEYFCEKIPLNGIFFDLGANIGSICIPLAKRRPDIKIIAVEASPRVFKYLKHNIELNACENIFAENLALSSADNQQLPFYSPEEKFGKGSLSAVYTNDPEYVSTITLDTLKNNYNLGNVDYIKIDVEGYEHSVFQGGKNLLSLNNAPIIIFEFADWAENMANNTKPGDAQRLLFHMGYRLYNFSDPSKPGLEMEPRSEGNLMILAIKKN
jgi:FkbM family methyltransferase